MLQHPWQDIRTKLEQVATTARTTEASERRTFLAELTEADAAISQKTYGKAPQDQLTILQYVGPGGAYTAGRIANFDETQNARCPHCGGGVQSSEHITWDCQHPKLVEARDALEGAIEGRDT